MRRPPRHRGGARPPHAPARRGWRVRRAPAGPDTALGQQRDQRRVGVLALADRPRGRRRRPAGPPRNDLRLAPTSSGQPERVRARRGRPGAPSCAAAVLAKPSPGSSTTRSRADRRRPSTAVEPLAQLAAYGRDDAVGRRSRRSRASGRRGRASASRRTSRSLPATTSRIRGSARPPETSLTIRAPAVERGLGHLGAHRVDRDDRAAGGELADHRDDPVELLGDQRAGGAGPGGLAADVEEVGALRRAARGRGRPRPRWCRSGRRRRRSRG